MDPSIREQLSQLHPFSRPPARAYRYKTVPTIRHGTTFQNPNIQTTDGAAQLLALKIRTSDPGPPAEQLLASLGTLEIETVNKTVLAAPVQLLAAAYGSVIYHSATQLTIKLSLESLFKHIPQLSSPYRNFRTCITVRTISPAIETIELLMAFTYQPDEPAPADTPIQQIATQQRQNLTPIHKFEFPMHLDTYTKGFFIEGNLQDIGSVSFNGIWNYIVDDLHVLAQPVGDRYLFIPFRYGADYKDPSRESFTGSYYTRNPCTLTVCYTISRTTSAVYGIYSNTMLSNNQGVNLSIITGPHLMPPRDGPWPRVQKVLNPERATCPITYEPITGDYCECDTCHYAFDATALQNYVAGKSEPSCPTCRAPWVFQTVYQQPQQQNLTPAAANPTNP